MKPDVGASTSVGSIRCPYCAATTLAPMPTDACLYFFECPSCRRMIRPKHGDCCVFCSYGDHQCPPKATPEKFL